MSTTERCETCRFFRGTQITLTKPDDKDGKRDNERRPGICRYSPPTPGEIKCQLEQSSARIAAPVWTAVSGSDWCGKYEAGVAPPVDEAEPAKATAEPPKHKPALIATPYWTGVAEPDWCSTQDASAAPLEGFKVFRKAARPPANKPPVPETRFPTGIESLWLRPIGGLSISSNLRMRLLLGQISTWGDLWRTDDAQLLAMTHRNGIRLFTEHDLEELFHAFLREGSRHLWPEWLSRRFPPPPGPKPTPPPAPEPPAPKPPVKATPRKKAAPKAISKPPAQLPDVTPTRQRRCQHCGEKFDEYHVPIADEKSIWDRSCVQCARELLFEETPKLEQLDYQDRQYSNAGRRREEDTDPWQDNSIRAMEDR